ncbi:MAG: phenylalanine--tRNA ligase subunit beta [Sulfolobaceae archaeon]|nr:phenylalanine--tRNA ligase subunit beta [Sulfolobaceae archaeon]
MVTITLNKYKLLNRIRLGENELSDLLFKLGCESKVLENEIEIEINANRLDLLHSAGINRAIDGLLSRKLGIPKYDVYSSDYVFIVKNVRARPYALAAIVTGLNFDEEDLKELIQFQEKLHDTIGRRRKKVAIGLHDLSKVDSKTIVYREASLDERFVPLNGNEKLSIKEILNVTEQGKLYGNISLYDNTMPVIAEDNGQILSMPPVINSDKTKLDLSTKDLFIDVTGTSLTAVAQTLDVLVSNLAELGGKIGIVKVVSTYADKSPFLATSKINVKPSYLVDRLGIQLSLNELIDNLLKARLDARYNEDVDQIEVTVPPYRPDIFREIDIVEEIAMSYGYENVPLRGYISPTPGDLSWKTKVSRKIRDLSIGAGFQEILTFVLTSKNLILDKNFAEISNPISDLYNAVRNSLIPQLLYFLSKNQHARFPIKVFEVGEVSIKDEESDTGFINSLRVAYGVMDSKVSYEDLQALVHQILINLGLKLGYKRCDNELFIRGRGACILNDGKVIGILGEVNPEVFLRFEITYPVAIAEIYLDFLQR